MLPGGGGEICSNYKDITCGKCSAALGKMYFATTSKLSALQFVPPPPPKHRYSVYLLTVLRCRNKYTLNLLALSFYHHASATPSLPIAATSEIYAQLHPDPETVAENIDHIMTICVMLREEQGDIIRELKKLGAATGIDMDLDEGEAVAAKESWREKVDALDGVVKKVKELEERVEEMRRQLEIKAQEFEERLPLKENKLPRKKIYDDFVVGDLIYPPPRRQEKDKDKKAQKATPPAVVMNKRKRKPGTETATTATAGKLLYIDLSNDEYTPAPGKPKSKKEVPNSQSADEDDGEYQDEQGNDEQEEEEEEEEIEDKVKSPAEKRRKGIAVSIVSQKEVAGRRVSLGRKGK